MHEIAAFDLSAILPFILIGFAAQLVDGALGMGFGVVTNTLLVTMGLPPAGAAAAVRTAEGFTSGAAGLSHAIQGNAVLAEVAADGLGAGGTEFTVATRVAGGIRIALDFQIDVTVFGAQTLDQFGQTLLGFRRQLCVPSRQAASRQLQTQL